jgi:UDP-N-acetylglucosamine 2-epimerase (non-hydrolysing)
MRRADLILSDSGGVQEEAPSVGTPVLVLREVTERPEAIESGWAQLGGTSRKTIVEVATQWLKQNRKQQLVHSSNPFGDGHAGERIAELLASRVARHPSVVRKSAEKQPSCGVGSDGPKRR